MAIQYQIDAVCTNDRCASVEFSVLRRQIDKTATSGEPYRISRIVCPTCKSWGDITGIKEIKK